MTAIVEGLGEAEQERIRTLRRDAEFFWVDLSASEAGGTAASEHLAIPDPALAALLDFAPLAPSSRKFYADGTRVAFPFTCYVEGTAVEVNVLVCRDYVLTVHEGELALPGGLQADTPAGRSKRFVVYAILDAMVTSVFDGLGRVEDELDELEVSAATRTRVRLDKLRSLSSQLSALRRRATPLRGIFERVDVELGYLEGLAGDGEHYFERIGRRLERLVDATDAAAGTLSTLVNLRLNETMYWLTVVATIFLPLTAITGFFGMNFAWLVDHIESPATFVLLGVCVPAAAVVAVVWLIRRLTAVEPGGRSARRRR